MMVKFGTAGEGGEEKQDAVAPTDGSGTAPEALDWEGMRI